MAFLAQVCTRRLKTRWPTQTGTFSQEGARLYQVASHWSSDTPHTERQNGTYTATAAQYLFACVSHHGTTGTEQLRPSR